MVSWGGLLSPPCHQSCPETPRQNPAEMPPGEERPATAASESVAVGASACPGGERGSGRAAARQGTGARCRFVGGPGSPWPPAGARGRSCTSHGRPDVGGRAGLGNSCSMF